MNIKPVHVLARSAVCGLCICLGLFPVATVSVQGAPPDGPYNLVFVSMTNTRADHLGVYGYARRTSPNIDRFATNCLVFENAFTHASWTLPAVISLMTSTYPFEHGMMNRQHAEPLSPRVPTLVDVLKSHGYRTAAFVGGRDYDPKFGHTSRFHRVKDAVAQVVKGDWKNYGVFQNTMPDALQWLKAEGKQPGPFFLLVHGYDTHCPFAIPKKDDRFDPGYRGTIDFTRCYWTFEPTKPVLVRDPSGEYEEVYTLKTKPRVGDDYEALFRPRDVRHMEALYDGEIYNADAHVGRLLDALRDQGLLKNTIVVIYADHGDMFGKHGRFMRGGPLRGTFYDDVLRIPLLIYHPDLKPGRVKPFAEFIDLAPTLLDYLGLPRPEAFRGRSLRPAMESGDVVRDRVLAGSQFTPSANNRFFKHRSIILAVRDHDWKLIWEKLDLGPGTQDHFELYDLKKDPEEIRNRAARHPALVQQYKAHLLRWIRAAGSESLGRTFSLSAEGAGGN